MRRLHKASIFCQEIAPPGRRPSFGISICVAHMSMCNALISQLLSALLVALRPVHAGVREREDAAICEAESLCGKPELAAHSKLRAQSSKDSVLWVHV
jgi:hypothetical protein